MHKFFVLIKAKCFDDDKIIKYFISQNIRKYRNIISKYKSDANGIKIFNWIKIFCNFVKSELLESPEGNISSRSHFYCCSQVGNAGGCLACYSIQILSKHIFYKIRICEYTAYKYVEVYKAMSFQIYSWVCLWHDHWGACLVFT